MTVEKGVTAIPKITSASSQSPVTQPPFLAWLIKLTAPRRMLWLGPLIAFLLSVPSLWSGYLADDYMLMQLSADNGIYPARQSWDLFNLVSTPQEVAHYREKGVLGWWVPDQFKIRFCRPLSTMLHVLAFKVFPNVPWVMHLGIILLYAALVSVAALLFRIFSSSGIAYGLAVLLFAVNYTHAYSVGWISSLNTLLACLFGFSSIWAHHKWRSNQWNVGMIIAPLLYIIALLSSEGGIATVGLFAAYFMFMEKHRSWKQSLYYSIYLVITIAYVLLYKINGFGSVGSQIYGDLFGHPASGAVYVIKNVSLLSLSSILSFPPLSMVFASIPYGAILSGTVLCLLIWLFRDLFRMSSIACFYGMSIILTTIPFALSGAQDRLLLWASLGSAGLIGELYVFLNTLSKTKQLHRFIAKAVIIANVFVSLLLYIPFLYFPVMVHSLAQKMGNSVPETNTVIVNAPIDVSFLQAPSIRVGQKGLWPDKCYLLYAGAQKTIVKRISERMIQIEVPAGWLSSDMERFTRSKSFPVYPGDKADLDLMSVEVIECTKDNRPSLVRFDFKQKLDSFTWVKWGKKGFEPFAIPDIGGQVELVAKLL